MKKSVSVNVVLNVIKTLLSIIFPLITFPYVSRVLQAGNIGKVQFATSIVSYFALIASLGISTYAIREGSFLKEDRDKLQEFSNQIFSFNMICTIISYIMLAITLLFMDKAYDYKVLIIIDSLTIIFTTLGVDWVNSIHEDYIYITIRTLIVQIITLFLTFILVRSQSDYFIYCIILVVSSVGANILNFFYVKRYCKLHFTINIKIKRHIKPILILFSSSLATTIYNSSDITMLGFLCDDYTVGIYYIGAKIYGIIKQLLNSAVAIAIPRISYCISVNSEERKNKLINNIFIFLCLIILPVVTGVVILNKEIITIISGKEYLRASNTLIILAISLIFAVIANFSSNLILITHKQEKKALKATACAAIANLILNFIFIPMFSEIGAAITTLIAEIITATISVVYARKYLHLQNFIKPLVSSVIGCIFIAMYATFIKLLNFSILFNIGFIFIGSIIIYFIFVFSLNRKMIKDILKKDK